MKKLLTLAAVLAPLALGACGSDKEKTVIVQPPAQSSGGTVVMPAAPAGSVTKICPAGTTSC